MNELPARPIEEHARVRVNQNRAWSSMCDEIDKESAQLVRRFDVDLEHGDRMRSAPNQPMLAAANR